MSQKTDSTIVRLYLLGVLFLMAGIIVLLEEGYIFSFFFEWNPVVAGFVSDGLPGRVYLLVKMVVGIILIGMIARYPAGSVVSSRLAFGYSAFLLVDSILTTQKFNPGAGPGADLFSPIFVAFFMCAGSSFWFHTIGNRK